MNWISGILTSGIPQISDVDPHWLNADPDPQNLVNTDPDPGRIQDNEIPNLISYNLLKVKKKNILKSLPKPFK